MPNGTYERIKKISDTLPLKSFPVLGKAIFRVKMFHFVWFFMHFDKLI